MKPEIVVQGDGELRPSMSARRIKSTASMSGGWENCNVVRTWVPYGTRKGDGPTRGDDRMKA